MNRNLSLVYELHPTFHGPNPTNTSSFIKGKKKIVTSMNCSRSLTLPKHKHLFLYWKPIDTKFVMKIHQLLFELCPCLKIDPDTESRSSPTVNPFVFDSHWWCKLTFIQMCSHLWVMLVRHAYMFTKLILFYTFICSSHRARLILSYIAVPHLRSHESSLPGSPPPDHYAPLLDSSYWLNIALDVSQGRTETQVRETWMPFKRNGL